MEKDKYPQQIHFSIGKNTIKLFLGGFLVLCACLLIIVVGHTLWQNQRTMVLTTQAEKSFPTSTPNPTNTWKTYSDNNYRFEYPSGWLAIGRYDDYLQGQVVTIENAQKTIKITISPAHIPYGFGPINDWQEKDITIVIDGENYLTKEQIYGWEDMAGKRAFVNFTVQKNRDYHILFGTGYPAADDRNPSFSDYVAEKATILKILSTLKFTHESKSSAQTSPAMLISKTYKDAEIGYQITYPESYIFTKTYGKDITKLAPTEVINGIQLDKPYFLATIVLNVINKQDAASLLDWWNKYSPKRSQEKLYQTNYTFKNTHAVKKSESVIHDGKNKIIDHIYFLWKDKIWFVSLEYYEQDDTNTELMEIVNSLILP